MKFLRSWGWLALCLAMAPLAFGVAPKGDGLDLPEIVVKGIDQVRLDAQRAGVLPLEPPRSAQTAIRVELSSEYLRTPELREAPPIQSPGCAYRNPVTGALARAGGNPEALYKSALERLSREDFEQAAYFLAKLRETHSQHPLADDAAFQLAEIQRTRGRTEEAIAFYRLVRGTYQREARYRLAWSLEEQRRTAEARAVWEQIGKDLESPFRAEALYRLGVAHLTDGSNAEAVSLLEEVLNDASGPPDVVSDTWFALGLARRNLGQLPEAEKALVTFLLHYPDHPSAQAAQVALGWSLLEQKQPREALRRFAWVLESHPAKDLSVRATYGQLRAYAAMNDDVAAGQTLSALETIPEQGPWIGWARADLAWLAFRGADFTRALELYRAAARVWQGPGVGVPRYMGAECLYLLAKYAEAEAAYRQVPEESPLRATALHRAGLCRLLDGDATGAEALFVQLLQTYPGYPELDRVRLWLAEALLRQDRIEESLRAYRNVSPDSEVYPQALYGQAWIAFDSERWDESADLFTRFLKRAPDDANRDEALLNLARAHFNRRQSRTAMDTLDVLQAQTSNPVYRTAARYYRGWMLTRSGEEEKGRSQLEALLQEEKTGPYAALAHRTLGWLDYAAARYDEALEEFSQVQELSSDADLIDEARSKRADALFNLQRFEDALAAYREMGETPEAKYGEALCLHRLGRVSDLAAAADRFAQAYTDDPRAVDLYLALGQLLTEAGDGPAAASAYKRAAQQSSDPQRSAEASLQAARSLVAGGDVEAGMELLEQLSTREGPIRIAALREQALITERSGDAGAASAAWARLAEWAHDRAKAEALSEAARWARLGAEWQQAETLLIEALAAAPTDAQALRQRLLVEQGETLLLAGDPIRAQRGLVEASEMGSSPQGLRALVLLGRAQETANERDDAVDTYLRLGYLYPLQDADVAAALLRAGELLQEMGDSQRARKLLQKLVKEAPVEWADRARRQLDEAGQNAVEPSSATP